MLTFDTLCRHVGKTSRGTCLLALLAITGSQAVDAGQAMTDESATEAVKRTITDLIYVLDDETLKQPEQSENRRREIEEIIRQRADYEEMAKRALGAPWSTLLKREQQEFVSLFVQLLRDTFAGRITEHHDEQVAYLGEHREEDVYAEVHTRLKGRKIDTLIDYRMINRGGDWRVYDVVIDGASIVSNYRSQFTSIIREVSYVGLVTKMKQKAIAVKVFERYPAP